MTDERNIHPFMRFFSLLCTILIQTPSRSTTKYQSKFQIFFYSYHPEDFLSLYLGIIVDLSEPDKTRNHILEDCPNKDSSFSTWVLLNPKFWLSATWVFIGQGFAELGWSLIHLKIWISGAWRSSGPSTWTSTRSHRQGVGILWGPLFLSSSSSARCCLIGGFCFLCLWLGMDVHGTAIFSWKGMFLLRLGIHFGLSFAISRCSLWCLLVIWTERSSGWGRGLSCRDSKSKLVSSQFCTELLPTGLSLVAVLSDLLCNFETCFLYWVQNIDKGYSELLFGFVYVGFDLR